MGRTSTWGGAKGVGTAGPNLGSGSGEFAVMAGGREGERGVSLTVKSVARTLFVSYVDLLLPSSSGGSVFAKSEEESSVLSSSSAAPSSCVVCPFAAALVGICVTIGGVGLVGCVSLLLAKSLSMDSHFKPSCTAMSQVAVFVRSLLSPSPSHLLAGRPCFPIPFPIG